MMTTIHRQPGSLIVEARRRDFRRRVTETLRTPASHRMSSEIRLADNVFFCVTEGQGVFLDLRADRYSAVPIPGESRASVAAKTDPVAFIAGALKPHIRELVHAGLLIETASGGHSLDGFLRIEPVTVTGGAQDRRAFGRVDGRRVDGRRVGLREMLRFSRACRWASGALKRKAIADTVAGVRARHPIRSLAVDDGQKLGQAVEAFARLRPWYPKEYLCLFDSLALLEFLAAHSLFPQWVFGVQAQPFGAHCWVQSGGRALNETAEFASRFTPIMRV